jgi:hypothetical protein
VKLTPWLVVVTVLVVTAVGPFTVLKDISTDNLTSQNYWLDLLAATIRSFASAILSVVALVAGAIGVPAIRSANAPVEAPKP